MTELKTLKDFEFKAKSWAGAMANAGRKYTIDLDGLKQEAIKLFKTKKVMMMTAQEFIHWWFNITEEDLK